MGTAREPRKFLEPDGFSPCKIHSHNRVTALTSWQVLEEPLKESECECVCVCSVAVNTSIACSGRNRPCLYPFLLPKNAARLEGRSSGPWQWGIWKNIPVSRNTDAICFLYSAVPPPFCGSSVAPCMLPSNMVCWQQPMAWPVKGEGLTRGRFCRGTVVSVLSSGIHFKIWKGSAYKYPLSCSVTQIWF